MSTHIWQGNNPVRDSGAGDRPTANSARRSRLRVVLAFAAIYLIWGSTYLAIRFAIETLPPLLMAGTRFVVAGTLLYSWTRLRGAPRPARLAALLIATVPLWMALLDWRRRGGVRPSGGGAVGLIFGFVGVALLVSPGELAGSSHMDPVGAIVLLLAALSWAAGSLYSRQAQLPRSPLLAISMEMLAGGVLLLAAGLVTGEGARLELSQVSPRSVLALGYLIIFGSLMAFSAYIWLLRVSTPARASTYAYVNPVVAVFLGWALGGEPLTLRTLLAAAVIVAAVVIITYQAHREDTKLRSLT
jgi:drug/metabolite transporter (DMT)-like permease